LVFKKPAENLKIQVKTDKPLYAPGDQVNYEVTVTNTTTNQRVDAYVSIVVTDDSVFSKVEERKQPASLASRVLLENEVSR